MDKEKILTWAGLILSIAAYPASCYIYVAIPMGIAALVLTVLHNKHYEQNRLNIATLFLSVLYLGMVALVLIFMAIYYHILGA